MIFAYEICFRLGESRGIINIYVINLLALLFLIIVLSIVSFVTYFYNYLSSQYRVGSLLIYLMKLTIIFSLITDISLTILLINLFVISLLILIIFILITS